MRQARRCWHRWVLVVVASWVFFGGPRRADADQVTVGLYAPSTPFTGPSERLQYVTKLAQHLSAGLTDVDVQGRVFARASDFRAAVRRQTVHYAVIDAPYAASRGLPYRILAATSREGRATSAWYMVARARIRGLADLKGKTVAISRIGHRSDDFLHKVLLEGQVGPSFFGAITRAPDSFSAVTMVKLGRADAAFVPSGVPLPVGLQRVLSLRNVGWPMFVVLPGADKADRANKGLSAIFAARSQSFGDGPLPAMTGPEDGGYRALRSAYARTIRRPIMALRRPGRPAMAALVAGRHFAIATPSVWELLGLAD